MSNTHKEVTTVSKHMTVNICRHQEDINLHNDSQNLLLRNICFFKEARFNLRKVISPFSLEQRKKALVPTESIVKNLPAMQHGFNPWVRKIPLDKEMANSLQYSCLGIPMERGLWRATFHGVTKS